MTEGGIVAGSPARASPSDAAIRRYTKPCTPPWWARGGHAQTLFGHLIPSGCERPSRWPGRVVELDDGDRLRVHEREGTSGARVVLLHGLSGDADSDYVRRSAAAFRARGHSVCAVNWRQCGSGRGLATRPYHSGRIEDLRSVLASLAPARATVVIGFSISGNIVLLHAARGLEPRADALIAVNPPIDLAGTAALVHLGANRPYELRFVMRLRRTMHELEARGVVHSNGPVSGFASLRELDDCFTAPVSGFRDAADYYRSCSSGPHLAEIEAPTVILTAADDPMVDADTHRTARLAPSTLLHVEPHGGHMGYLAHDGADFERWLDGALVHYVDELVRVALSAPTSPSSRASAPAPPPSRAT